MSAVVGSWDFVCASRDLPSPKRTRLCRKLIKKTPGIDEERVRGPLGTGRGPFSTARLPMPDVGAAGNPRSRSAAPSHTKERRLLRSHPTPRRKTHLPQGNRSIQRRDFPAIPQSPVGLQHQKQAARSRYQRQRALPQGEAPPNLEERSRARLRAGLPATLQPGTEPYRTSVETYPAPLPAQSLFRDARRSYRSGRDSVRKLDTRQRYVTQIMRNYLRRCVYFSRKTKWPSTGRNTPCHLNFPMADDLLESILSRTSA